MTVRIPRIPNSRLPHPWRRILSRTRWLYARLRLSCTCDLQDNGVGRHLSTCGVHLKPIAAFPRTQCWLLGHQPRRTITQARVKDIIVSRGWQVQHESRSYEIEDWSTSCRVCGTTLDSNPWSAQPKLAMGRDGGALGHLWIRAGRGARWAFRTRV